LSSLYSLACSLYISRSSPLSLQYPEEIFTGLALLDSAVFTPTPPLLSISVENQHPTHSRHGLSAQSGLINFNIMYRLSKKKKDVAHSQLNPFASFYAHADLPSYNRRPPVYLLSAAHHQVVGDNRPVYFPCLSLHASRPQFESAAHGLRLSLIQSRPGIAFKIRCGPHLVVVPMYSCF
jgi:hypothetical protein